MCSTVTPHHKESGVTLHYQDSGDEVVRTRVPSAHNITIVNHIAPTLASAPTSWRSLSDARTPARVVADVADVAVAGRLTLECDTAEASVQAGGDWRCLSCESDELERNRSTGNECDQSCQTVESYLQNIEFVPPHALWTRIEQLQQQLASLVREREQSNTWSTFRQEYSLDSEEREAISGMLDVHLEYISRNDDDLV